MIMVRIVITYTSTVMYVHNRVGTIMNGHKRVWTQTCMGTNVSGHMRVGTIVWAKTCLGTCMYGHSRVVSDRQSATVNWV